MKSIPSYRVAATGLLWVASIASAHDPVFSPGPHVLFKEGIEIHLGADREAAGPERRTEMSLELTYGLGKNWAAGIGLPYQRITAGTDSMEGIGGALLFTKYRFWRRDRLGVQRSAAVLLNVMLDGGADQPAPGTNVALLGFTYGYESLTWYRWSSVRYRHNGQDRTGLRQGDRWFIDFAMGYRPVVPVYLEADSVWILELNGEQEGRAEKNRSALAGSGGSEWFISPGIFWTLRNLAIKSGVQIPVASNLNGHQAKSGYRVKLEFEWHL